MDSKNIVFICGISGIGKSFITRQIRDLYIDEIEKVNVDALFLDQTKEEIVLLFYKNFYSKFNFLEKVEVNTFIDEYLEIFNEAGNFDTPKTLYYLLKKYLKFEDESLKIIEEKMDDIYRDIIAPSFSELIIKFFKEKNITKNNILVDIGFRNIYCLNTETINFFKENEFKINIFLIQPTAKLAVNNLNRINKGVMEILFRNSCIEFVKDFIKDDSLISYKDKTKIFDILDTKKYTKEEITKKLVDNKEVLWILNNTANKYFLDKIQLLNKYYMHLQTFRNIKLNKIIIREQDDIFKLIAPIKDIVFNGKENQKNIFIK